MAAVSANIIHHQQQSGHSKVSQDEQSEEESNDGSLHSVTREKNRTTSSPEYKPTTPDAGVTNPYSGNLIENSKYVCSPNQSSTRSPNGCGDEPEIKPNQSQFNSSFSMHNVLKMKSERDSVSPPPVSCSNSGVFSTEKLLENTPNYSKVISGNTGHRNDESSYDETPNRTNEEEMDYRESDYNIRGSSPTDDEEKSRLDISGSNVDDGNSCCSEDTVLSVGNEAQVNSFDAENRTCSTANSTAISPRSSPTPSPASSIPGNIQNLSSFKHIQSHLSAISQLSQNLHGRQHMLLRPNPITPNPLMFLNQSRLLFNPHLPIQANVPQLDAMHQSPHSLSSSPTSVNPAMSGLSPNDLSPTASINSHHLSPSPPGFDGKLSIPQNISTFAGLPHQIGQSLRFYKQNAFPPPGLTSASPNVQTINNNFSVSKKISQEEKLESRKMHIKSLNQDKLSLMNGSSPFFNPGGINERLFSNNNVLSNNPNITNHNPDIDDDRHNLILNHNGLKFSIDNILKADFGRRITDPLHKRSRSGSSKHKFGAAVLNPLAATGGIPNPSKQVPLQHINIKESFGSSAFKKSAFQPSKDSDSFYNQSKSSNNVIPNPNLNSSSSSSGSSRLSSERLSADTRIPLSGDSKSTTSLQNNIVSSSVSSATSSEKPSGATNPIDLSKQDLENTKGEGPMVWPAWVYCTRYSDRPSSGPRTRRPKKQPGEPAVSREEEKRPRTAFSGPQLARLKHEFAENRYLTERRRQQLSAELGLNEAQIKIWFQNKRAKIKKASGQKNPLALQLMAQGLYNHSTVPLTKEEEELQELHAREAREANA